MIEIDPSEIDEFAENMINIYNKGSKLKLISNLIDYSKEYKDKEYFQIARRILIPKEFFKKGNRLDNTPISRELADSIVFGEISFLIDFITKKAENNKLKINEIKEFSYDNLINIIFESIPNPSDLFLPIDKYFHEIQEWRNHDEVEYIKGEFFIKFNNYKIKIHWSNRYIPLKNIVVINKNNLNIIQKRFEDMKTPKELKNISFTYKKGEKLNIYFADSDDISQFDFYFRSLIAIDELDLKSAFVIKIIS